jgi:dihydrolipoyl dehydrogenase
MENLMNEYDLIVIGAGPGGYVAAIRAAQLGWNVACVEQVAALGGTCLRVGCIPSKALLESSEKYTETKKALSRHGVKIAGAELDLSTMMKRKDKVVRMLTKGIEQLFKKNNVTRYSGHGCITGPGAVSVEGDDETVELKAKNILIATGSDSANLPGVEMDGDKIGTSTEALSYSEVPAHLVVIGAGFIGLELGSVWMRLGAKVTVLEYLDKILPGIDEEVADEALKILKKQGMKFQLGCRVAGAKVQGDGCIVECDGQEPISCDRVLLSVGRKPHTDNLGLESVGIKPDKRGCITVDDDFATSALGVYAIGDVIRGPMLAHKAEEEGIAAVEKMVTGKGHVNYDAIPGVAYTHPEVATVGKTEEQLKEAGVDYRKGMFPFMANGRARSMEAAEGFVKMLADAKSDKILGVHIIGPCAGELIAECVIAIEHGLTSDQLARTCHAHPTLSEAVKEAAYAVDKRAIHM